MRTTTAVPITAGLMRQSLCRSTCCQVRCSRTSERDSRGNAERRRWQDVGGQEKRPRLGHADHSAEGEIAGMTSEALTAATISMTGYGGEAIEAYLATPDDGAAARGSVV